MGRIELRTKGYVHKILCSGNEKAYEVDLKIGKRNKIFCLASNFHELYIANANNKIIITKKKINTSK